MNQTPNIVIVAFGLYEWLYTCSLMMQYRSKRNSPVYWISAFGAVAHFFVIIFYLITIDSILNPNVRPTFDTAAAIFAVSSMVQACVLTVGLIRFRYLYSFNPKSVPTVTVAVIIGIVSVLIVGISAAILLATSMISFALLNIITGVVILYCALMDVSLSIAFLNALVKGFGMNPVSTRELMFSNDAKRLAVTGLLAAVFGFTQVFSGVLQLLMPTKASIVAAQTDWSNFIPAWSYIYALNTFLHMSYSYAKTLLAQNSISAIGFQGSNNSGGKTSNNNLKKHASTQSLSERDDVITYTDELQLQEISATDGNDEEKRGRIYQVSKRKEISHVAQIVNEAFTNGVGKKEEKLPLNSQDYGVQN